MFITVYKDKSFTFVLKTVTYYILKAVGLKGWQNTGRNIVRQISKEQIKKIAEDKMEDMNASPVEQAIKQVEGPCSWVSKFKE